MVGLGEREAADQLARDEFWQIFFPLRLAAVGVDRPRHQRGLHRHRRAIAGIDALKLARDEAGSHLAEAGTAILFRQRRAEKSQFAHLGENLAVKTLLAIGREDARKQLALRIVARGVAHHALLFGKLAFEIERVLPVEGGRNGGARGRRLALAGLVDGFLRQLGALRHFLVLCGRLRGRSIMRQVDCRRSPIRSKPRKTLARPTRFEPVTSAFGVLRAARFLLSFSIS